MNLIDRVFHLFAVAGQGAYFGEAVSETEHALQTARLARLANAPDSLVAAALLHDVGHLLHGLGEDVAGRGIDARHEDGGAAWLADYFVSAVVEPVRLHVEAKRYLCAVDAEYSRTLSPSSLQSLRLQGGPLSSTEAENFLRRPFADDAVRLRRWDDEAKVAGLDVPGVEAYRETLRGVLRAGE